MLLWMMKFMLLHFMHSLEEAGQNARITQRAFKKVIGKS